MEYYLNYFAGQYTSYLKEHGVWGGCFHMGGFHRVECWPPGTQPPVARGEGEGGGVGHLHLVLIIQPGLQMANPVTSPEVYPSPISIRVGRSSMRSDTKCDLFPRVLWAAVMIRCWVEVPPKQSPPERERQPNLLKAKLYFVQT